MPDDSKTVKVPCAVCGNVINAPEYGDAKCSVCGQKYEYIGGGHSIVLRPDQVHLLYQHWQKGTIG